MTQVDLDLYIALSPSDLLSKWGFDDGDMMYGALDLWVKTSPWFNYSEPDNFRDPANLYLSPTSLLIRVVVEELRAHISDGEPLTFRRLHTSHNPIRVESARSLELDGYLYEQWLNRIEKHLDAKEDVLVPSTKFHSICEAMFPLRSPYWLGMFSLLWGTGVTPVAAGLLQPQSTHQNSHGVQNHELMKLLRSLDERYNTIDTVEGLVAQCGEMEVGLAAELVSNGCDTTVLTGKEVIARIKEALLTAQKLLRD